MLKGFITGFAIFEVSQLFFTFRMLQIKEREKYREWRRRNVTIKEYTQAPDLDIETDDTMLAITSRKNMARKATNDSANASMKRKHKVSEDNANVDIIIKKKTSFLPKFLQGAGSSMRNLRASEVSVSRGSLLSAYKSPP